MLVLRMCGLVLASLTALASCDNGGTQPGSFPLGSGGTNTTVASSGGATSGATGGTATGGNATGGSLATVGGSGQGGAVSGGATGNGGVTATGGNANTGGNATTGGNGNLGGTTATGGKASTGGSATVGGSTSTGGGSTTTGGKASTGGSATVGGSTATGGGSTTTGGKANTGGATTTGGATATGGKSTTGGSTGTGGSTTGYKPCPTDGSACKIMPFGDSITDGYNGDTPGGYRVELFRLAHSAGKNITFVGTSSNGPATVDGVTFPPKHEGHSGWTIATCGGRSPLAPLVATVMPQHTPHIVLLMAGTNDCIDNCDLANAPTRLGALIDSIYAQLPNILIVVGQPPPSRGDSTKGDDTGLSARIKTFNDAIPAVVKTRADAGKHILVVDMYTPINPNKAALMEDQWHPNLAGYVIIGTQWYSVLQSLL